MRILKLPVATLVILCVALFFVSPALAEKGPVFEWQGEEFNTYSSPYGNQWRVNGDGNLELFHPEGGGFEKDTTIKTWSPEDWEQTHGEVEVEAECLGRTDNCVKDIEEGDTRLPRGTPPSEIERGAEVITREREEAPIGPEPEVVEGMDTIGEWGGTISADALVSAGSTLLGGLLLGPEAFKIGVDIGNKIDQLFGFSQWKWAGEEAEDNSRKKEDEEDNYEGWFKASTENAPSFKVVSGIYLTGGCNGQEFCSPEELANRAAAGHIPGGIIYPYNPPSFPPGPCGTYPGNYGACAGIGGGGMIMLICQSDFKASSCEPPPTAKEETEEAKPGGIPVPETAEQERENGEHETGPYGSRKKLPPVIVSPGADTNAPKLPVKGAKREPVLPKTRTAEALQENPVREVIIPSPAAEKEEVEKNHDAEKKLIPESYPGETAKQYQKRLEGLGFTNVTVSEVGELNENPNVGPSGVADVSPTPGTQAETDTSIKISENPANAPEPGGKEEHGGESHTGVGPPTLPGFHFPDFGVLCKGFPFGVPCWLAETISSWSATSKAPVLGIEEWEVGIGSGPKKTINATFDFSKLEPIMEKVRPAMIAFATIGLVLLFFSFAKGGGPPSGSGTEAGSGEGGDSYSGEDN